MSLPGFSYNVQDVGIFNSERFVSCRAIKLLAEPCQGESCTGIEVLLKKLVKHSKLYSSIRTSGANYSRIWFTNG